MFQAFYSGLSGLMSFTKGLDQISNNVANMNTSGFKAKDLFYKSISGGCGTSVGGEYLRDKQGDIRQTGNDTDLAIRGEGFFVLRDEASTYLTRAGQFFFNSEGLLVDKATGYRVASLDSDGKLSDINISDKRFLSPKSTKNITLKGNISADGETHAISNITTFDSVGKKQTYSVEFSERHSIYRTEKNEQGEDVNIPTGETGWSVNLLNSAGESVVKGELRFDSSGKIIKEYDSVTLKLAVNDESESSQELKLSFSDTTCFASGELSDLGVSDVDGHAIAGLTKVSFDEQGELNLTYSNGDDKSSFKVALAKVNDQQRLNQLSNALFSVNEGDEVSFGFASDGQLGKIVGNSIELSNVDLAEEFAEMMIVQRGYQSSSRILSVANEMIETLYNSGR
ncbi:flagellar basal-body rod protein FlgF [Vibrio vulnificus]|nr:flagellar basal-body rod protein FlgF [Vibrio vulnificus]ELI3521934.1 flagellar basal-body rod protein FlgF [Vibrio vulnificus]